MLRIMRGRLSNVLSVRGWTWLGGIAFCAATWALVVIGYYNATHR